jgi:hypothetical protein
MNIEQSLIPKKRGQQLVNAERLVLIGKLVDLLSNGYMSTWALSKKLKISHATIETYRPLADQLIAEHKFDRNVIRNLQVKRTYQIIEQLMIDLKSQKDVKARSLIYSSIYKFSSHLALITGLNIETHVNIDPTKLVIIRSNKTKKTDRVNEVDQPIDNTVIDIANETKQLAG